MNSLNVLTKNLNIKTFMNQKELENEIHQIALNQIRKSELKAQAKDLSSTSTKSLSERTKSSWRFQTLARLIFIAEEKHCGNTGLK